MNLQQQTFDSRTGADRAGLGGDLCRLGGGIVHELRTPLGALMSALELVSVPALDLASRTEAAEVARRQARRLSRLVDDFDTLLRACSGDLPAVRASVDVSALLAAEWAAVPKQPAAEVRIEPGLSVEADPAHLRRAVVALLELAAKAARHHTPAVLQAGIVDGGVAVRFHAGPQAPGQAWLSPRSSALHPPPALAVLLAEQLVALHGGRLLLRQDERGMAFSLQLPVMG